MKYYHTTKEWDRVLCRISQGVPRETRDHFHHYDDSWCAVCWTKFDPGTTGECPECGGSIYTAEELREMYP